MDHLRRLSKAAHEAIAATADELGVSEITLEAVPVLYELQDAAAAADEWLEDYGGIIAEILATAQVVDEWLEENEMPGAFVPLLELRDAMIGKVPE